MCADVVVDATEWITCRHVIACVRTTWHMCVGVRVISGLHIY